MPMTISGRSLMVTEAGLRVEPETHSGAVTGLRVHLSLAARLTEGEGADLESPEWRGELEREAAEQTKSAAVAAINASRLDIFDLTGAAMEHSPLLAGKIAALQYSPERVSVSVDFTLSGSYDYGEGGFFGG